MYPLVLPLGMRMQGRRAVVVGGSLVAERRVAVLLAAGADVLVVAPALSPFLESLAAGGRIMAHRRGFAASDLDLAWLVLACADEPQVNTAVIGAAERRRIWCASDDAAASLAWAVADVSEAEATVAGNVGRTGAPEPDSATATAPVPVASSARRVLVLGGARSGKSLTAEKLLAHYPQVDYIATGAIPQADYIATGAIPQAGDAEWAARVLAHKQRRPAGWRTTETLDIERELAGLGAADAADTADAADAAGPACTPPADAADPAGTPPPVLVDCLSTWLAGVMDDCGVWAELPHADHALTERTEALIEAWRTTGRHVVAVSNEVGSGVVPGTVSGRRFRDELGSLNARIAAECDEVWLCTAGIARRLR